MPPSGQLQGSSQLDNISPAVQTRPLVSVEQFDPVSALTRDIKTLTTICQEIKEAQLKCQTSVKQELTQSRREFEDIMKTKFDQLHRELNRDIQQVSSRVDTIELKVDMFSQNYWFSHDRMLVVSRLNIDTSRSEIDQAQALVRDGLGLDTPVVRAKRMAGRNGRPGLLKVELPSVDEKIEALRRKQNLRPRARYEHVYVRSFQTQ